MLVRNHLPRPLRALSSRDYGRLSVMLQTWFDCTALFSVSAGSFRPVPKVESAIVRLVPSSRYQPETIDRPQYAALVRKAFAQRRKTLRNTLKPLCDSSVLESAGIDPGRRAEQLEIQDFIRLQRMMSRD